MCILYYIRLFTIYKDRKSKYCPTFIMSNEFYPKRKINKYKQITKTCFNMVITKNETNFEENKCTINTIP